MLELFFFFILIFITVSLGIALCEKSILIKENALFYNKISTSYFIGMAFYIVILKSYYFIFKNLLLTNILVILTIFLILVLKKKNLINFFFKYKVFFSLKKIIFNFLIITFLSFLVFSIHFDHKYYYPEFLNSVGSLHSGKYVWLSNFINTCNIIPTLGQNTGQSILTYFTGFIFNNLKPYLYLYLWLIFTLYFLSIYFFSFLREYFFLKKNISFLGIFFIMFGGTALSFTPILVIDTGSPFILTGYSDTLFGVFSVTLAYNIFTNIKKGKKLLLTDIFLILLLLGGNFFMAPQNIIFFIGCLPFFLFNNSIELNLRKKILVIFFISLVYFVPQGGMLTPPLFQDSIKSAESSDLYRKVTTNKLTESVQKKNFLKEGIEFVPGYFFYYDGIEVWKSGQQSLLEEGLLMKENIVKNLYSLIWTIEKIFINSLIVLFFPILGLVLIMYWHQMLKKNSNKFYKKERVGFLISYTNLAFVFGVIFTFFFSFNGYKWEFSRFMIPFITFGMISYFIALSNLFKFRKIFLFLFFFSLIGPIFSIVFKSQKNILNIHPKKIELFLSSSQKELKNICFN